MTFGSMTSPILPPKLSRLRFSLRTLFIAMTVVLLIMGVAAQRLHRRHVVNETIWQHRGFEYRLPSQWQVRIENVIGEGWWDGTIFAVEFTDGSDATDDDLTVLDNLPYLEVVGFGHCPNITDKTLRRLCKNNTHLVTIIIYDCPHLTEAGIVALSETPNMRRMRLDTSFENDGLKKYLSPSYSPTAF
jgi:hypothetical protein